MAEQTPAEKEAAEQKAAADKAAKEAAAERAKVKGITYVGGSDVREIDAASWKVAGVEDQNKVVWHSGNKHTVSTEDLSAGAVDFLLGQTGEFEAAKA
jgi:hypothetical protein